MALNLDKFAINLLNIKNFVYEFTILLMLIIFSLNVL